MPLKKIVRKVIVLSGPTATGKTQLSIELAQQLSQYSSISPHIINFDSLLFYKELIISTARPTPDQWRGIPHHLVGMQSIDAPINAGQYCALAKAVMDSIPTKAPVILVGGSGFYLKALIYGMYAQTQTSQEVLEKAQELYQKQGIAPFLEILQQNDPETHQRLHSNDHFRIRRAVEFFWQNQSPFSQHKRQFEESFTAPIDPELPWINHLNWEILHFYLDRPKKEHWPIILNRTQKMIRTGLVEEIRPLWEQRKNGPLPRPLTSIGPKQAIEYLRKESAGGKAKLEQDLYIATRQLAKAQRTFFARIRPKIPVQFSLPDLFERAKYFYQL